METKQVEQIELQDILDNLKNFLYQYYKPVHDPTKADIHLSTDEIYWQLFQVVNSEALTREMVAQWLNAGGFTFYDYGEMRLEWMLKKN